MEGRQKAIKRRLQKRFQREGYIPLSHKGLAGFYDEETGKYKPGVWEEMQEYKERLVTEKLEDQDFKGDLDAARECLREARERRDVAWKNVEPLREKKMQEEIAQGWSGIDYGELWARYVEASDTYSEARRKVADDLRAKYKLNRGWLSWLHHYLEMGQNKPDELMLYSQDVKRDKFGGSYIQTEIYFPLSQRMLDEIAYWTEFRQEEAFGVYYRQRTAGGRPPGQHEKRRDERLELAQDYYDTQDEYRAMGERLLTEEEFCKDRGASVRTLRRALKEFNEFRHSKK